MKVRMAEEINDDWKGRLDRMDKQLKQLASERLEFREECRQLYEKLLKLRGDFDQGKQ
ncbi:MAG TPA: hypothetical protein VIX89_11980 [Bryobacteraceae bacterium]